ncbi:MAG: c-type cytochrome [Candidatus Rokubacteria bacterium]|nr:c-type cytochrome [Candidatus Rokubacteria bacterium]
MLRGAKWTAVAALVLLPVGAVWAQPVFSPSQDPLAGSRVFASKGCSKCHSIHGLGGKVGPDLGRIQRPRSFYDLATAMWNHLPKMADRMQRMGIARPTLDGREAADLIAFLYTLNYFDAAGSLETGRKLFTEKKCIICHTVGGTGGVVGPNLDFLSQLASPMFVAAALWNHGPQMAETMKARGIDRPAFTGAELRDLLAFVVPASAGPREGPLYVLPGRADVGRQLFSEKRCIECHALGGAGGKGGPDLLELGVRRSPLEFAAAIWNKVPAMTRLMQVRGVPIPQLRAEEMADIVAYLYAVRYFAEPGSISRGWALAVQKGCLFCHGVYGERGKPASDLTRAKQVETPAGVVASLWNHAVVTAAEPGGKKRPWPEFRPQEMADLGALLQALGRPQETPRR